MLSNITGLHSSRSSAQPIRPNTSSATLSSSFITTTIIIIITALITTNKNFNKFRFTLKRQNQPQPYHPHNPQTTYDILIEGHALSLLLLLFSTSTAPSLTIMYHNFFTPYAITSQSAEQSSRHLCPVIESAFHSFHCPLHFTKKPCTALHRGNVTLGCISKKPCYAA